MGDSDGLRNGWRVGAVLAAVVACVCGVIGLDAYEPGRSAQDLVYSALQLFVLEGDPLDEPPYNVWLEIARFLAPATTAYALFEALRALLSGELRRRRLRRLQGHAIVCGDALPSWMLARHIRSAQGLQVVLVGDAAVTNGRRADIQVVRGDPRDEVTLRAAGIGGAAVLYSCAPGSGTNAAVVLAATQLHGGRHGRFEAFAQVDDDGLVDALRAQQLVEPRTRRATIDFFALDDIAARAVLADSGVFLTDGVIVVVGSGPFALALLRTLFRTPPAAGTPRTVTVHTDQPGPVLDLAERLGAKSRGYAVGVESLDDVVADPSERIFVCLPNDEATLARALRLLRSPGRQVTACLRRAAPFARALRDTDGLRVVGMLDEACRPDRIEDAAVMGRAARAIHQHYVDQRRAAGDTAASNASVRDWDDLPRYLQESNYAQAEHVGAKLREIGATVTTTRPTTPFAFLTGEVEKLAKLEHQRWMTERSAAGYVWGPSREGNHHPDLVDWPNLAQESRAKDIETITFLPHLLESAGLFIDRRSPRNRD